MSWDTTNVTTVHHSNADMTTVTDGKASRPKPVKGPPASLISRPVATAGDQGTKGENSAEPTVNPATRATKWGTSRTVLPFGNSTNGYMLDER